MNLLSRECTIDSLKCIHNYLKQKIDFKEIDGYTINYALFMQYAAIIEKINRESNKLYLGNSTVLYTWVTQKERENYVKLLEEKISTMNLLKASETMMESDTDFINSLAYGYNGVIDLEEIKEYSLFKTYVPLIEDIIFKQAQFFQKIGDYSALATTEHYKEIQLEKKFFHKAKIKLYLKKEMIESKEMILGELIRKGRTIELFSSRRTEEYKQLLELIDDMEEMVEEYFMSIHLSNTCRQKYYKLQHDFHLIRIINPKIKQEISNLLQKVGCVINGVSISIPQPEPSSLTFQEKAYTKRKNMVY